MLRKHSFGIHTLLQVTLLSASLAMLMSCAATGNASRCKCADTAASTATEAATGETIEYVIALEGYYEKNFVMVEVDDKAIFDGWVTGDDSLGWAMSLVHRDKKPGVTVKVSVHSQPFVGHLLAERTEVIDSSKGRFIGFGWRENSKPGLTYRQSETQPEYD